jgi:hypothetical protein
MEGDFSGRAKAPTRPTRGGGGGGATTGEDLIAKIVIPLKPADLREGVNQVEFSRSPSGDAYSVLAAQIQSVPQARPWIVGQTYHLLSRGLPPKIRDFDAVFNLKPDDRRRVEDTPAWGRQGLVNYYRSGMGSNLDRTLQMFEEARINLRTPDLVEFELSRVCKSA